MAQIRNEGTAKQAWRPRNESAADLANETQAAALITSNWSVSVVKLSERLYGLDWAFFRDGTLSGWGEYKKRDTRYQTLLLSAAKYISGMQRAQWSGVPFVLFVEWPDGLFWYKCSNEPLPILMSGNSRGQNGDIEPCVHIDSSLFVKV